MRNTKYEILPPFFCFRFIFYFLPERPRCEKVRYLIIVLAGTAGNPGDEDLPDGTPGRSASAVRHARSKFLAK
jgi:hypothetical protein